MGPMTGPVSLEDRSAAESPARYAFWREGLMATLKVAHSELPTRNAEGEAHLFVTLCCPSFLRLSNRFKGSGGPSFRLVLEKIRLAAINHSQPVSRTPQCEACRTF